MNLAAVKEYLLNYRVQLADEIAALERELADKRTELTGVDRFLGSAEADPAVRRPRQRIPPEIRAQIRAETTLTGQQIATKYGIAISSVYLIRQKKKAGAMHKLAAVAVVWLVWSGSALAQELGIAEYAFRIYAPGASAPIQETTFAGTDVACDVNQPTTTNTNIADSARVFWDDKDNAGRACRWSDSGTGPLLALAVGSYEGTLERRSVAGVVSGESVRVPFVRLDLTPPPVPTGVRILR